MLECYVLSYKFDYIFLDESSFKSKLIASKEPVLNIFLIDLGPSTEARDYSSTYMNNLRNSLVPISKIIHESSSL